MQFVDHVCITFAYVLLYVCIMFYCLYCLVLPSLKSFCFVFRIFKLILPKSGWSQIKSFNLPLDKTKYAKNIYWVYGILLKKNSTISLETLMKKLKDSGIETRNFFWPLHKQPVFKKMGLFKKVKLPVSEYLAKNGLYLPTGMSLTLSQQKFVINKVKKFFLRKHDIK